MFWPQTQHETKQCLLKTTNFGGCKIVPAARWIIFVATHISSKISSSHLAQLACHHHPFLLTYSILHFMLTTRLCFKCTFFVKISRLSRSHEGHHQAVMHVTFQVASCIKVSNLTNCCNWSKFSLASITISLHPGRFTSLVWTNVSEMHIDTPKLIQTFPIVQSNSNVS